MAGWSPTPRIRGPGGRWERWNFEEAYSTLEPVGVTRVELVVVVAMPSTSRNVITSLLSLRLAPLPLRAFVQPLAAAGQDSWALPMIEMAPFWSDCRPH